MIGWTFFYINVQSISRQVELLGQRDDIFLTIFFYLLINIIQVVMAKYLKEPVNFLDLIHMKKEKSLL